MPPISGQYMGNYMIIVLLYMNCLFFNPFKSIKNEQCY